MLKNIKLALAFAALSGLLAGCSSNKPVDNADTSTGQEDAVTFDSSTSDVEDTPEVAEVIEADTTFYFEFDSANLTAEARAALLIHAENLKSAPRSVRLEGHADERGSREYNMALGERRANAVRDFLVLQGVGAYNLETISYGEEQPVDSGSYESAWSKNRRVELK